MDAPAHALPRRPLALPALQPAPIGSWVGAFAVVVYLGLKGGGFDPIVQGEVGVVAWWAVAVGSLAGILPITRLGRRGWIALAVLAGYLLWMVIAIGWSPSHEHGWSDAAHTTTMLGLFVLALAVQGRHASRHFVNGLAAGIVVIAGVALLSRLEPEWFPANVTADLLTATRARLSYPLNYWNALAALVALGLPLLWHAATSARTVAMRSLAAGALPLLAVTLYFTLSRGGALAAAAGLVVFLMLVPNVLPRLATLVIAGSGSAILIAGAVQRGALADGLGSAAARDQGGEMLAMVLIVCAGVAMLQAALTLSLRASTLSDRAGLPPGRRALVLGVVLLMGVVVASAAHSDLSRRWDKFKNPNVGLTTHQNRTAARFQSSSGNGRYQYWSVAVRAGRGAPLKGTGAGSYELWWKRHATLPGKIRHAHSQVFQTFGELGVPGALLLGGFLVLTLVCGVLRALRGPRRALAAAATAGCAAFVVSATVDWSWDVTVVPVAFLGLAAVVLAPAGPRARRQRPVGRFATILGRFGPAVAAVLALLVIALPLAGASYIRDSRADFNGDDLASALRDARHAQQAQPYAATPRLQEGFIFEHAGRLGRAATAVRSAISKEPKNPAPWIVLSRIEANRGHPRAAVAAYRRARALDPQSSFLQRVALR
jgi:hypothetical protein